MKPSRIAVALLILVALEAGYYFYDTRIVEKRAERERVAGLLLDIDQDKVTKITIRRPDENMVLARKKSGWTIVEPLEADADPGKVRYILYKAGLLKAARNFGKVSNLADYGLDEPVTVTFDQGDGGKTQSLEIGCRNPTGSMRYVMVAGDVAMANGSDVNAVLPTLFDVRDRKMFRKSVLDVTGFQYKSKSFSVSAVRGADKSWKLTSPVEADADDVGVEAFIRKFMTAEAAGFVDDTDANPGRYGFDNPEYEFTATFGDKGSRTLLLGAVSKDGDRYARMTDSGQVVMVSGDIVSDLPESVMKLRDRSLVSLETDSVKKISLVVSGEAVELEKDDTGGTGGADGAWRITSPQPARADGAVVSGLLYDLAEATGVDIVAEGEVDLSEYGLDNPGLSIKVVTDSDEYTIKAASVDKGGVSRFYVIPGGLPLVMSVEKSVYDSLALKYDDLLDKRLFAVKSEEIERININRVGQVFDVTKSGDDYRLLSPHEARVTHDQWNRLVWAVKSLEYERTDSAKDVEDAKYGFDKPELEITVYGKSGLVINDIAIGRKTPGGDGYYVRSASGDTVYIIDKQFVTTTMVNSLDNLWEATGR